MCVCAGKRDVVQLATISAHRASWVDSKLDMGIQGSDLDNAGSRSDDARRLFTVPQRYTTQLRSQSEHRGSLTGSPLQPTSRQLLSRRSSRLFCTGSRQRRRRFPDHRRQIRQHQYHCQTAQELRSQNSWTRVHLRTRCQSRAQFVLDQRRTSPHSSFQCVACSSSPSLTTKFLLSLSLSLSTQFLLLSFGLGVFDGRVFLLISQGNRKSQTHLLCFFVSGCCSDMECDMHLLSVSGAQGTQLLCIALDLLRHQDCPMCGMRMRMPLHQFIISSSSIVFFFFSSLPSGGFKLADLSGSVSLLLSPQTPQISKTH